MSGPHYYIRARYLAEKTNALTLFVSKTADALSRKKDYHAPYLYMRILSYEGLAEKLIEFVNESVGYFRYDYLKYCSRSFVYRALNIEKPELEGLQDFIKNIEMEKVEGIVDMQLLAEDSDKKEFYLMTAVDILKEMVDFHIKAAQRKRYEKAAYYCSVIRDIYTLLKQQQEFNGYYDNLINLNKRRPALRDEMLKKIGRQEN